MSLVLWLERERAEAGVFLQGVENTEAKIRNCRYTRDSVEKVKHLFFGVMYIN